MKIAIKIILLLAVIGYLVFSVLKLSKPTEDSPCQAVDIIITDSIKGGFVTEDYVQSILTKNHISLEGQKMSTINIEDIELLISKDPYIEEVACYYTAANHFMIEVKPQHPILHVMAQNGDNYYLDINAVIMPVGIFNADLCVATGNITKAYAKQHLIALAKYIHEDEFWDKQIEQINVVDSNNVELIPRVGEHIILLGNTDNYEDKLNRMLVFYQNGLPKVGWNKYKTINVSFDGQVVCTKRKQNIKH